MKGFLKHGWFDELLVKFMEIPLEEFHEENNSKISEKNAMHFIKKSVENVLNGIFGCQKFPLNSSDHNSAIHIWPDGTRSNGVWLNDIRPNGIRPIDRTSSQEICQEFVGGCACGLLKSFLFDFYMYVLLNISNQLLN